MRHLAEFLFAGGPWRDGFANRARRISATSRIVELAGRLDVEAKAGQAALDLATLVPVQPDLVFGDLNGIVI